MTTKYVFKTPLDKNMTLALEIVCDNASRNKSDLSGCLMLMGLESVAWRGVEG